MDMILAILGHVMQEAKSIGSAKEHQHDKNKRISKAHITTQYIVT